MYSIMLGAPQKEEQELEVEAVDPMFCESLVTGYKHQDLLGPLEFLIAPQHLEQDYLSVSNIVGGELYSERFIAVLKQESAPIIVFPVQLLDQDSQALLSDTYSFLIVKEVPQAIDWERSESWTDPETGDTQLTHLVLTSACEAEAYQLFRPKGLSVYLVHHHLRTRLEMEGIKGIAFTSLDTVFAPDLGLEKLKLEDELEQTPNDSVRWHNLGDLLRRLHRPKEALTALDRSLFLQSDQGAAWWARGWVLRELGHLEEALKAFRQATNSSDMSIGWAECSEILREMERYEEALQVAQQGVQVRRNNIFVWVQLGETYLAVGNYQAALRAFEQAMKLPLMPFPAAYLGKGDALIQLEKYEEALATYTDGLVFAPLNIKLWQGKARAMRALRLEREAEAAEEKVQQLEREREERMRTKHF